MIRPLAGKGRAEQNKAVYMRHKTRQNNVCVNDHNLKTFHIIIYIIRADMLYI